ncbi:MAG TPA: RIP metalloprotease RseP [Vicinamibacterales bacterium]|jgi:regulator of sigma E protease|nr:RIP metalloprotease RseP [Vicinamibacterales bacterium]
MITLLAFAVMLGVLVFVHELGHFVAAKRVGIKVLKFQLGFNPTVVSFQLGDTEYGIGALPLGGYVKMAGDNPDEARPGEPDEFLSKSKWARFQVLIMGPTMNILLALVLTTAVLYRGGQVPAYQDEAPVVSAVAAGSPAEHVGIVSGDRITAVAGHKVDTWDDFFTYIAPRANHEIELSVLHNGIESTKKITPVVPPDQSQFQIGDIGVMPNVHPVLIGVRDGEPGAKAGLKVNDAVVAVNGQAMTLQAQLIDTIHKFHDQTFTMTVLRDGQQRDVPVATGFGCEGVAANTPCIGVSIGEQMKTVNPTFPEAMVMSGRTNVRSTELIFQTVWGLLTRETSPKQLMGPVAIAQLSGETARLGWTAFLGTMAMISLNLGLVNLLPIPVLDGGHIFIMALEGLARRDFSVRVKEKMLLAGFAALMMLMVTVIYNDLTRISWIEHLMPWR